MPAFVGVVSRTSASLGELGRIQSIWETVKLPVAAGNYTIIQVGGLATLSAVGNVTALVVNQPAVPAAAGQIAGSAAAAANMYDGCSLMLPQFATAAASLLIPCFVNFMRQ